MPRSRLTEYLTSLIYDGIPNVDQLGTAGTWLPAEPAPTSPPDQHQARGGDVTPLDITTRRSS
jgi:hypothetical protein